MTPAPPVSSTCQLTQPTHPFIPPAAYPAPARPPDPGTEWFGTARLWTILTRDGEVWDGLPLGADGLLSQKTFWWSADFDVHTEQKPAITVTGKRLDGPGLLAAPAPGTNAQAEFGSAMLQGIGIPSSGCWRITATYRGASLSYIVWVG